MVQQLHIRKTIYNKVDGLPSEYKNCNEPKVHCHHHPSPTGARCSWQSQSRHSKTPNIKHTRATPVTDEEKHRLDGLYIQTHQQPRASDKCRRIYWRLTPSKSRQIRKRPKMTRPKQTRRRNSSTCPPPALDAPPKWGYGGEDIIMTSMSSP